MDAGAPIAERLGDLVERLQPLRPSRILLFGSAARGETDQLSDIDVIVVADQIPPRFLDRLAEAYDLIDPHYALDIFVYAPDEYERMRGAENPLIEAAEASGRVLYERFRCVRVGGGSPRPRSTSMRPGTSRSASLRLPVCTRSRQQSG
jgi:predicted nucleotidyltransferase